VSNQTTLTPSPSGPVVDHYGACAGGMAVLITSVDEVDYQKVCALLWQRTELTGWHLITEDGVRNQAGKFIWIFRRYDEEHPYKPKA
jgi:hypothetical protein